MLKFFFIYILMVYSIFNVHTKFNTVFNFIFMNKMFLFIVSYHVQCNMKHKKVHKINKKNVCVKEFFHLFLFYCYSYKKCYIYIYSFIYLFIYPYMVCLSALWHIQHTKLRSILIFKAE